MKFKVINGLFKDRIFNGVKYSLGFDRRIYDLDIPGGRSYNEYDCIKIENKMKKFKITIGEESTIVEFENKLPSLIDIDFQGALMLQISKSINYEKIGDMKFPTHYSYIVTNGVDGYGRNCFQSYKDEIVYIEEIV